LQQTEQMDDRLAGYAVVVGLNAKAARSWIRAVS
jgi:hypothetical protein